MAHEKSKLQNSKLLRWPHLLLGIISMLFAGIIYAWSILKVPLATEFHWNAAQLALNYTLTISFFCIGVFISGLQSKKTTPKFRFIIGAICILIGFLITSNLSENGIFFLYLSYGIIAGTGIGFIYNTVISTTSLWFPDKKGLCIGALMMAFGFSALIIGNVAGKMIETSLIGWRGTFLILAIVIGLVLFISAFLIKTPREDTKFPLPKISSYNTMVTADVKDYKSLEMIKHFSFWKIFIFLFLLASLGSVTIAFAKDLFINVGAGVGFSTTMVGVLSVFNGFGRLFSGAVFDRFGIRKTQLMASAVAIISPLLVLLALLCKSLTIGITGLCLCGFTYGFAPTLVAAFSSAFYGQKYFALNFSIINFILIMAAITATVAGVIVTATGSFTTVFILLIGCSVVGLFINLFIRHP